MLEFLFVFSVFCIFFAYFGYPLTLWIMSTFRKLDIAKKPIEPSVSMIITAYNEEKRIREKLENTLSLEYPRDKLQIIVASDGSNDKTNDIVAEFTDQSIELLPIRVRAGKENAQKDAVAIARGDIVVFTDVATRLNADGLKTIVSNFADPSIGCVSSEDRLMREDGKPAGEGAYVRYEMWLRRLESQVNSLVGLSGSFFAARKSVCMDFSGNMQSDFRTLLNSIRMGMRGVSDPQAIGYYLDIAAPHKEADRKIRTVIRGLTVFFQHLELINPFNYGLFSFQLFCHKLLRWLVPFFMLTALVTNLYLFSSSFLYALIGIVHISFYIAALWTRLHNREADHILLKLPSYFLMVNVAIAIAWWRFLRGQRIVMWTPSDR